MPKKKIKKRKKKEEEYIDMISMHEDLWNGSGKTREQVEEEVFGATYSAFGKIINYPKGHPKWRG